MLVLQSSDGAVLPCNQKPPDSEAERRAKLHEAAKQALRASSVAQAEITVCGTTEQKVTDSSEEEQPLAQPKREESKDKKPKKPTHSDTNSHKAVGHHSEVVHTQEVGQHASRYDHQLNTQLHTRPADVLPAVRLTSTFVYNHACYDVLPVPFERDQA